MTTTTTNTIDATSTIREVTVYENRAQVHRQATVSLAAGLNAVVLADLPKSLDRDALQVGFVEGADGVALRGIQFDTRTRPNPEYAAAIATRDSAVATVERLKRALQAARDDAEAIRLRQVDTTRLLERATSDASGAGPAVFDPKTWEGLLASYATRTETELGEQRAAEDRIADLRKELEAAELRQHSAVPAELSQSVVTVLLGAREAVVKAVLVVSYLVSGASWEPEYELRVKSETLEMAVHYHGVVRQTTEEDWRGVRMSLSTARPTISGRQPELTPWRVGIYTPPVYFSKSKKKSGMFASAKRSKDDGEGMWLDKQMERCLNDDDDEEECLADYEAPAVESAAVSEAATSVSFVVPRAMTILRDGEPCRAALVTVTLPVTLTHVTAPSALEAVFASAKATNTSEVPFVAGAASVFLDGQFVTSSSLPRTPVGEELLVSVGRDEGVSVKRKMLNRKRSDEGGMFSARRDLLSYSFVTTLKNGRRQAAEVVVQERVPSSDDEDLVVTLVKPAPSSLSEDAARRLKDDGILEITVKIAPNTSAEVALEFTVSSPQGRPVYGL